MCGHDCGCSRRVRRGGQAQACALYQCWYAVKRRDGVVATVQSLLKHVCVKWQGKQTYKSCIKACRRGRHKGRMPVPSATALALRQHYHKLIRASFSARPRLQKKNLHQHQLEACLPSQRSSTPMSIIVLPVLPVTNDQHHVQRNQGPSPADSTLERRACRQSRQPPTTPVRAQQAPAPSTIADSQEPSDSTAANRSTTPSHPQHTTSPAQDLPNTAPLFIPPPTPAAA